ncbi:hypothetical protein N8987_03775 [Crocinitomix sp.]|nr:hypothetical protein [Crocinitomix sp.]
MKVYALFCFIVLTHFVFGQDLTVSDVILDELKTVVIETEKDTFILCVHYPNGYNPQKSYKAFIGLSGGDQSLKVVNYCYAAWFRSGYFNKHITIMPVVDRDTINFKDFDSDQVTDLLNGINEHFNLEAGWLIAGTSNGGNAAFNFVSVDPKRFEGLIVAPGMLSDSIEVNSDWSHLNMVLAYGQKDNKMWIDSAKKTGKQLKKLVNSVEVVELVDQGHILTISFNVDKIYDPYFLKK